MTVSSRWIPLFLAGSLLLAQTPPPPPPPPAPPAPPAPMIGVDLPSGSRTEQRTEKLAQGSKLWVKNRNGGIRVTGWDKDEVALTAQIRDSEKRRVELVLQRKGSDLDIEAVFQQPSWSFGIYISPRCEMTLQVPRKLLGYFRTTNGTVTAENLEGYARCETTNGNVLVNHVRGEVQVETTNGSIEARGLAARIKGSTTNGRIILEDIEGGVRLETTNGTIRARNLDGWGEGIHLESTNGSIEVDLGKATGDLVAENSNGSMDIKVAGAQMIELTKHSAHLKVPGRNQPIHLETTNGSIRVK
jgi:Putative adhesin